MGKSKIRLVRFLVLCYLVIQMYVKKVKLNQIFLSEIIVLQKMGAEIPNCTHWDGISV